MTKARQPDQFAAAYALGAVPARYALERRQWKEAAALTVPAKSIIDWDTAHGVSIPAEKFRIVGRPQVEDVQQVDRADRGRAKPVVLYAPTWRGHVEETMLYSLPHRRADRLRAAGSGARR